MNPAIAYGRNWIFGRKSARRPGEMDLDRPLFFIRRGDRLAARTKAFLYAWRFARQVDGQVIVSWPPRDHSIYNSLASEYYSPLLIWNLPKFYATGGCRELFFMEGDYRADDFLSLKDKQFEAMRPYKFQREFFQGKSGVFLDDQIPYRFEGEDPAKMPDELRALYRRLPMDPTVAQWLDEARKEIGLKDYVVLHLRRGDIINVMRIALDQLRVGMVTTVARGYAIHTALRTAPYRFYYPFIERALQQKSKIVFFSDSPETLDHFVEKYGSEPFIRGPALAAHAKHPIQKAFIDFTLIAEAREVIGTSTGFTNVASMLGGNVSYNAAAWGPLDDFLEYFFGEVLLGAEVPEHVRQDLVSAFVEKYEQNHAQSKKRRGQVLNLE
jgi:hypothetical protein